jgi:hypothetical protein
MNRSSLEPAMPATAPARVAAVQMVSEPDVSRPTSRARAELVGPAPRPTARGSSRCPSTSA